MNALNYLDEWRIEETTFDPDHLGKYEAIMAQGNGYLGLRNVHEEEYSHETRDLFVAGIFNKFSPDEVTELANFPDITAFDIKVEGKRFSLLKGVNENYHRLFNFKTGESKRSFTWSDEFGHKLRFNMKRIVSMDDKHLIVIALAIENLGKNTQISMSTGIDSTKTNGGSQNFEEGDKRYFDNKYLYLKTETTESKVTVAMATCLTTSKEVTSQMTMGRRNFQEVVSFKLAAGETFSATKYAVVRTQRDLENADESYLGDSLISALKLISKENYASLLCKSAAAWQQIWNQGDIQIESNDFKDQLLLNFARYHIHIMSPVHDDRLNIGAKGMSGEGYKGHTFWDTEVYILPYFIYTYPQFAKNLVNYRVKGLAAAKVNAKRNGYLGAQYPWESAWLDDGEVTPKFGDIDIITGQPTPILTGEIEHHVTSDVVHSMVEYISATADTEIETKLFEVAVEAAKFWCSRCIFNKELKRYEIHDVIGPDEYKEHVDNNAYTNYLAKFTLDCALEEYNKLIDKSLVNNYAADIETIKEVAAKLYLPQVNNQLVMPQDDTYLQKKILDLTKYVNDAEVNTLFREYNLDQANGMQISKQADVLLLLLMFADQYSPEVLRENWEYYFPKTLHDSSLSLSTHCNYALLIGEEEIAYKMFRKSFEIDLGNNNMASSDMGIHSASMGGIWENVVQGFGGFSVKTNQLAINPKLPQAWKSLTYTVIFHGTKVKATVVNNEVKLEKISGDAIAVEVFGKEYVLDDKIVSINY